MTDPSILLVEDDEITNFISKNVLSKMGISNVDVAINGAQGLEHISKSCPDLIFLDITMPVKDGFEFLEECEDANPCPNMKVAMLTSSIRPADKERAFRHACVVDYIEKPLLPEKVEHVIGKL